ncbi:TEC1 family protein [Pleurotus pulmonarius]|nr:hypothetical protein EYR36_002889 [Pleurotus pulmonarius]
MKIPPARSFKHPKQKSLTPRRKHWKTGSNGMEVWPEHIEEVFVQGLREYRDSPLAAHSFGRSKFRNQILVEHLARAGITRSKKQVASHIQVLRSMWKGTPEFYLVSNNRELYALNPSTLTELEEYELKGRVLRQPCNPSNPSPNLPPDGQYESRPFPLPPILPVLSSPPILTSPDYLLSSIPTPLDFGFNTSKDYGDMPVTPAHLQPPSCGDTCCVSAPRTITNRVTSFCLIPSGAPPLVVSCDSTVPPANFDGYSWDIEAELHMISPGSGEHEELAASVALAAPFVSGSCTTQVFSGQRCIHKEAKQLYSSLMDPFVAFLPADSALANCRSYLNEPFGTASTLTQEWVIDGITLLYAVFVLRWSDDRATPSARLVACRPHQDSVQRGSAAFASQPSQVASTTYHTAPFSSPHQHTALRPPSPSSNTTSSSAPSELYSNHNKTPSSLEYSYCHPSMAHIHPHIPTMAEYFGSSLNDPFI